MLELPEVEVLRHELERELADKRVKAVEVPAAKLIETPARKAFIAALEGARFTAVERRGTWLALPLDGGEHTLLLQLGSGARLIKTAPKEAVGKEVALHLTLTPASSIRLIDPSKDTRVLLVSPEEATELIGPLGMDPFGEPVSWDRFGALLLTREGRLKSILMDQSFIAGIGLMYSDEILFHAGLRFDREPRSLSPQEIRRLHRSVVEVVHEAIKHGGTSLEEGGFVSLTGKPGGYGEFIAVYRRDGRMSPRARGPIVKARFGSQYTYFCEQTQV